MSPYWINGVRKMSGDGGREGTDMTDEARFLWHRDCKHKWEPVQMLTHPVSGQPDLDQAKCYMVCRECNGWTYDYFEWVGTYLGRLVEVGEEQP